MRDGEWDHEADAASVVTSILGGRTCKRDPGGGATPTHDFDAVLPDGRVIAVEATRWTDPRHRAFVREIEKRNWTTPTLAFDWAVSVSDTTDLDLLRRNAAVHLLQLETAGVDRAVLRDPMDEGPGQTARQDLFDLGVRLTYRITAAQGDAVISPYPCSGGGSTSLQRIVDLAEQTSNEAGNARKLAAANADERHMFIWIEASRHAEVAAMRTGKLPNGGLPTTAPRVPEHVDRIWTALAFVPARIWTFDRTLGWRDQGSWRPQPPSRDPDAPISADGGELPGRALP